MKNFMFLLLPLPLILLWLFKGSDKNATLPVKDYNECVQKITTKWGEPNMKCEYYIGHKRDFSDTYTVFLKNVCDENIDLKCCVQEQEKHLGWRCITRMELKPNDTLVSYACKGKGKYLFWARRAGDREIELPTDEQVKAQYKE